jgi:hypothetical protein
VLFIEHNLELVGRGRDAERDVHCMATCSTLDGTRLPEVAVDAEVLVDLDLDTELLASDSFSGTGELLSFLQSPSRPEPLVFDRFVRPPREQDTSLVLEDDLHAAFGHPGREVGEHVVGNVFVVDIHTQKNRERGVNRLTWYCGARGLSWLWRIHV